MPRRREFGISDYLLALVIALLVGLVILRKWKRDRAAKRAEIRKLLRLAEEEAARVEAEAVVEYTYSAAVTPHQCAVCFSPTTTRCSRCKAVRYW
jgi:ubiquitin carboxyl-terminal hydrolase 36/42